MCWRCVCKLSSAALSRYSLGFLTHDHQDEEECGHACCDVEHHLNVIGQLVHVLHIWNQDWRNQKSNGDAELRGTDQQKKRIF